MGKPPPIMRCHASVFTNPAGGAAGLTLVVFSLHILPSFQRQQGCWFFVLLSECPCRDIWKDEIRTVNKNSEPYTTQQNKQTNKNARAGTIFLPFM